MDNLHSRVAHPSQFKTNIIIHTKLQRKRRQPNTNNPTITSQPSSLPPNHRHPNPHNTPTSYTKQHQTLTPIHHGQRVHAQATGKINRKRSRKQHVTTTKRLYPIKHLTSLLPHTNQHTHNQNPNPPRSLITNTIQNNTNNTKTTYRPTSHTHLTPPKASHTNNTSSLTRLKNIRLINPRQSHSKGLTKLLRLSTSNNHPKSPNLRKTTSPQTTTNNSPYNTNHQPTSLKPKNHTISRPSPNNRRKNL